MEVVDLESAHKMETDREAGGLTTEDVVADEISLFEN